MDVEVGSILTGKVTGITKFGAFVTVASGQSGLVHISEIAHTFVSNVSDHLALGQEVTVKVLGAETGKLNLSIKAVTPPPARDDRGTRGTRPNRSFAGNGMRPNRNFSDNGTRPNRSFSDNGMRPNRNFSDNGMRPSRNFSDNGMRDPRMDAPPAAVHTEQTFEDRLKRFMQDSDSKISGLRMYSDKKGHNRRRSH
ncbi:MAG: S1 RNA-binding domain-containing protein [Oscillospiraceae bacterium]|jgi:S1 RNA binding domain protein|nr:S1 RNA-binding domain-containing protein [Oscillospiraceae bacterium]